MAHQVKYAQALVSARTLRQFLVRVAGISMCADPLALTLLADPDCTSQVSLTPHPVMSASECRCMFITIGSASPLNIEIHKSVKRFPVLEGILSALGEGTPLMFYSPIKQLLTLTTPIYSYHLHSSMGVLRL